MSVPGTISGSWIRTAGWTIGRRSGASQVLFQDDRSPNVPCLPLVYMVGDGVTGEPDGTASGYIATQLYPRRKQWIGGADMVSRRMNAAGDGQATEIGVDPRDRVADRLVLVGEDDRPTARLIEHRLQQNDARTVSCGDGDEAWNQILRRYPDVIVYEQKLPGMLAIDLLRRLSRLPNYRDIPVLVLGWPGNDDAVVKVFQYGAADFVEKPFSPPILLARISRLL